MKWTAACILLAASMASARPQEERAFSLFSVVTFPNEECTTTMDPTMRGLCITAEECTENGGTASGNCASGFGVCCFTAISAAATVTNNVTYIQNDGFPTTVGSTGPAPITATNAVFPIQGSSSICQIRLDFDTGVFQQPTQNGNVGICGGAAGDSVTVTSPSTAIGNGISTLCGTLTGQHMYIDNDGANPAATLTIATGTGVFGRSWKILVRMIECNSPSRAPEGCAQYFTGSTGQITSLNGGIAAPIMLQNLIYNVCIRREAGFCTYTLREARSATGATPDSFQLGATAAAVVGAACTTDFIIVPNTGVVNPKYCGGVLSSVTANTVAGPVTGNGANFQVTVIGDSVAAARNQPSGFDLIYSQVPC